VIVPRAFPERELRKYGAGLRKVHRYDGIKEDVYLADFQPDPNFADVLHELGVDSDNVLVVARPPAREALYHRFENELFDELLKHLNARDNLRVILIPRSHAQGDQYRTSGFRNVLVSNAAVDGANLIAAADLVVSAGGTMNREAAALGVPAVSIYAGEWAAIDEELRREGRLLRIQSRQDIAALVVQKKTGLNLRRATHVRDEVIRLILE
jgi:hypothetical protein